MIASIATTLSILNASAGSLRGAYAHWHRGLLQGKDRHQARRGRMDEKEREERGNRALQATINAFNRATKGALPIIKKQVAESMMKGKSEAMKQSFMSRIDLS